MSYNKPVRKKRQLSSTEVIKDRCYTASEQLEIAKYHLEEAMKLMSGDSDDKAVLQKLFDDIIAIQQKVDAVHDKYLSKEDSNAESKS